MTSQARGRLSVEARKVLRDRMWQRLLQPLPSEIVPPAEQGPAPDEERDERRDKAVGR
jgi:hypothetical protein